MDVSSCHEAIHRSRYDLQHYRLALARPCSRPDGTLPIWPFDLGRGGLFQQILWDRCTKVDNHTESDMESGEDLQSTWFAINIEKWQRSTIYRRVIQDILWNKRNRAHQGDSPMGSSERRSRTPKRLDTETNTSRASRREGLGERACDIFVGIPIASSCHDGSEPCRVTVRQEDTHKVTGYHRATLSWGYRGTRSRCGEQRQIQDICG